MKKGRGKDESGALHWTERSTAVSRKAVAEEISPVTAWLKPFPVGEGSASVLIQGVAAKERVSSRVERVLSRVDILACRAVAPPLGWPHGQDFLPALDAAG